MAYIGNIPADKFQTLQKQSFTTSATDTYTLSYAVTNPQDLALFINNVRQNPNDAYSVSNTTLTLSSSISGSDTMYAVFLGRAVETIAPATGSVTNTMLANSSITLNGSAVSLGGSATVGGSNTPAFFAKLSGNQTVSDNTQTLINFDTEVYDTDNQYDTTNKRFVAPSAGKYVFTATAGFSNFNEPTGTRVHLQFYKNGSLEDFSGDMATVTNNASADPTMNFTTQMSLTTNDYVDVRVYQNGGSDETLQSAYARFFGYRLIGV